MLVTLPYSTCAQGEAFRSPGGFAVTHGLVSAVVLRRFTSLGSSRDSKCFEITPCSELPVIPFTASYSFE